MPENAEDVPQRSTQSLSRDEANDNARAAPLAPEPRQAPLSPIQHNNHNGRNSISDHASARGSDDDKDQHDSEAETEKLSDVEDGEQRSDGEMRIKSEDSELDRDSARSDGTKRHKVNGAKAAFENSKNTNVHRITDKDHGIHLDRRRRKSSGTISTAPSWASNSNRQRSPAAGGDETKSPSLISGQRARSNSTNDSRKRKSREDKDNKFAEPARQKHKTEGAARDSPNVRQQPISPVTASAQRQHRRSASTQSAIQNAQGSRKRRDPANLYIHPLDPKDWDAYASSDDDSSPRRPHQAKQQHSRLKRASHRSLTSPARTMPKKDVDKFGATRLAREAERGDLDIVKAAYEEKPDDLDRADFAGIAPLQKAALNGHVDIVRFLIESGCKTNCQSENRDTPLIDSVENGHLEVVRLLLHEGKVNPHHQNKKGQRAIDVLGEDEDDDDLIEIKRLLEVAMHNETDTRANKEPEAALSQSRQSSSLLYNEYNAETLRDKAAEGNLQLVGELLNSNIKPNIACGVAAARGGHDEILSLFISFGLKPDPDPEKHSDTFMIVAIGRGHLKVIELLLGQEQFDPTRKTREGLTYAQLAEQRRGPKWEIEKKTLDDAYKEYISNKGKPSPNRSRKHALSSASSPQSRFKQPRKSSPRPLERSSSPVNNRRPNVEKSAVNPDPNRRTKALSAKEAPQQHKRRRRVVEDDESSMEEEEDRRPSKKLATKHRSVSEGEGGVEKAAVKRTNDARKRSPRASKVESDDSDADIRRAPRKVDRRRKSSEALPARKPAVHPTPDASSDAESHRKNRVDPGSFNRIKGERPESPSHIGKPQKAMLKELSPQIRPPSRTPSPIREARLAEERRKHAAAQKEADEARRVAEEQRRKEEEEQRKKEEEQRKKEEERRRQASEQRRVAKENAALARAARLQTLPPALRRACEKGLDRPLHFEGETLGITRNFFPIHVFPGSDINQSLPYNEEWIPSYQVVGVLGLRELDISTSFPQWEKRSITESQREILAQKIDMADLAQEQRFPMEGMSDFDEAAIQKQLNDTREKFRKMGPLYWVKYTDFEQELRRPELDQPELTNGNIKKELYEDSKPPVHDNNGPTVNGHTEVTPEPAPTSEELLSRSRQKKVRDMLRKIEIRQSRHIRINGSGLEQPVNGVGGSKDSPGVNGHHAKPKKSFMDLIMQQT